MNMPENTMSHVHLVKEDLIGSYDWKGDLDLLNIVMIGLAKELPGHNEMYELHRLLGTLLSQELTADEKLSIIGEEYKIPIEENMRKDVNVMCNLSQGIEDKGRAEGRAEGEAKIKQIVLNLYHRDFTIEQIAAIADKDAEEVKNIIEGKPMELV